MATFRRKITFVVTGVGTFPFDMLRYDQAWPTDRGVTPLTQMMRGEVYEDCKSCDGLGETRRPPQKCKACNGSGNGARKRFSIELQVYDRVTQDRWLSFGWRCEISRSEPA